MARKKPRINRADRMDSWFLFFSESESAEQDMGRVSSFSSRAMQLSPDLCYRPFAAATPGQTRPGILLSASVRFRSQGIPLHVAQHRDKMLILLDGKRLETPLPDVAAAAVVPVVTTHMGRHQPLHPTAQIAAFAWPED